MPFYHTLDGSKASDQRTMEGLLRLRDGLRTEIPKRSLEETLLVGTWNIRDFDTPTSTSLLFRRCTGIWTGSSGCSNAWADTGSTC